MAADPQEAVRKVIRAMNAAWLDGRIDEIELYYDENVVLAPPGSAERVAGRRAVVQSYRDYMESATTHRFDETALHVDLVGDVAVAMLHFRIQYELAGDAFDESGMEIYVLTQRENGWRITWRTQIPSS